MKPMIILFALLIGASTYALPASIPSHPTELQFTNIIQRLTNFITSENGRLLFKGDFEMVEFQDVADQATVQLVTHELVDQFGEKRCFINQTNSHIIELSNSDHCMNYIKNSSIEMYATLFHEILNQMNIELPNSLTGSKYSVSKKLLLIDPAMIIAAQRYVLHQNCKAWSRSAFDISYMKSIKKILNAKGYSYNGAENTGISLSDFLVIQLDTVNYGYRSWGYSPGKMYLSINSRNADNFPGKSLANLNKDIKLKTISYGQQYGVSKVKNLNDSLQSFLITIPDCVILPTRDSL